MRVVMWCKYCSKEVTTSDVDFSGYCRVCGTEAILREEPDLVEPVEMMTMDGGSVVAQAPKQVMWKNRTPLHQRIGEGPDGMPCGDCVYAIEVMGGILLCPISKSKGHCSPIAAAQRACDKFEKGARG